MGTREEDWAIVEAAVSAALVIYDEWQDSVGWDKNAIQQGWREEWDKVNNVHREALAEFQTKHSLTYYGR